jgi:hypothetical protein
MPTVREELRSLLPALAVALLLPVPLLNFVDDGSGRAFAFAYLFLGCVLLAAECFRPAAGPRGPGRGGTPTDRRTAWTAKMGALAVAMGVAALTFTACHWAISGRPDRGVLVLAFVAAVPALGMVPCLTLLAGNPYAAVVLAALLLGAVKLAGCAVVRVAYGPAAQAEGRMAMSWAEPNLLVWLCLAGGLLCSAALGVLGFRRTRAPDRTSPADTR